MRCYRKLADIVPPEVRSRMMAAIKSKDTKPEVLVRSFLHRAGFRFRNNVKDLPGRPDIVLPKYRTVVFVHGCFWHQHEGCPNATMPKSRKEFWKKKLDRNTERDKEATQKLREAGWNVAVVWECEIDAKHLEKLVHKLRNKALK